MRIIQPVAALSPFIESFIIIESDEGLVNRLLPDTAIVMAFRYMGTVSQIDNTVSSIFPTFSVSGIWGTSRRVSYNKGAGNILTKFKEGGAAAFLPVPLHELFETSIALEDLFEASALSRLEEEIYFTPAIEAKVALIEQFFMHRLPRKLPDLLVSYAVDIINKADGTLPIRELANSLNLSQDAFEKRFRKTIGTTPKQFSNIVRMKSLICLEDMNHQVVESALGMGFFDQSHFIREFRKFAGQTPRDFFGRNNLKFQ